MVDFDIVKREVDALDAAGLLKLGAPQDEYDGESRRIAKILIVSMTAEQAAFAMCRVFSNSFGEHYEEKIFVKVAENILAGCRESGYSMKK